MEGEAGRVDRKEGAGRGDGNGKREIWREVMGRGRFEGGDEEGATGRGRRGWDKGRGRRRGKRRGDFTDGYDGMPGWI